jgi:hypothetical protein
VRSLNPHGAYDSHIPESLNVVRFTTRRAFRRATLPRWIAVRGECCMCPGLPPCQLFPIRLSLMLLRQMGYDVCARLAP